MITTRRFGTSAGGMPVYGYERVPGIAPVGAMQLADALDANAIPADAIHAHDFFVIVYFERAGSLDCGRRDWPVAAGEVHAIAPGDVVGIGSSPAPDGRAVHFSAEALGAGVTARSLLSWRAHPLLSPFAQGIAGEPRRWTVAPADRRRWVSRMEDIDRELGERRVNHRDAVVAHLVLLLVELGRVARQPASAAPVATEPLLVEVFGCIDEHYGDPLSLRDVARAVNLSPGHLTTVVRSKTGRTVQAWITERRHAEARSLLVDTDLAVDEIGRRVGYRDPSYFARSFRKQHGTTPLGWRRAARDPSSSTDGT